MADLRPIPDVLADGLAIVFVGFNPSVRSAETGHHYANPTNRFWRLLFAAGITDRLLRPEEDYRLLQYDCGLTNIVARPSRRAEDITKEEYRQGRTRLLEVIDRFKPRIVCFTGVKVYQEFSGRKGFHCGPQTRSMVDGVIDFPVPSPSGLVRIQFPEQLEYYKQLKNLADQIRRQ